MSDEQKSLGDAERTALARELTEEQMEIAPAVERPVAIFTAGQPGSGKSMIVNRISVNLEDLGAPPVVIDADEVRPNLPYMRDRIAKGDLEIPAAAYGDAGTIAAQMMEVAAKARRNIVYDGTLSNSHYARINVEKLKLENYRIEIHGMAVAPDLSHASTYERRELQIKSSPTGFGRGVGDDFHNQAVAGLVETIGALQADGKVDAIVLYDRQGKVVGSTRMEEGRWVPDEQMAEALRSVHQHPDQRTLRDAAASWDNAASMMRDRGADPQEQGKVDAFRNEAAARTPSPAENAARFDAACAAETKSIVERATRLESALQGRLEKAQREREETLADKPTTLKWMPGAAKAVDAWDVKQRDQFRTVANTIARIDRVAPYTQTPIPGYPSKVEEMAAKKVERRDPQAAREAIAFRVAERQEQARTFAESRSQQQGNGQKLSR
ncbi:zeta toxin family protein [Sphingomonas sp. PAMC 26605]|uniref:zeta toxin family protein n=1 Tax=Sphingomonas sp. PAMC 26605 TaxID=1112214 RepID=UPI00026CDE2A|nr:zeta toxin family protein [Sphingomonas sp. PAMC 26605]